MCRSSSSLTWSTDLSLHRWYQPRQPDRTPRKLRSQLNTIGNIAPTVCKIIEPFRTLLIFPNRFYQVIMMIDIFQYSNMYTLRKSMQWLADETHIKEECGPYVTRQSKKSALLFLLLSHVQTQSIPSRIGQHFCTCTHGLE